MQRALCVKNLNVSYHGEEAIRNVNFQVSPYRLVGVVGPNGAGKSTLLKALLGLISKDRGQIKICGQPIKDMRKQIAYVPQRNQIDWGFPIAVQDVVLLGTYPKLGLFHRPGKKEKAWGYQCLEEVGMQDFNKHQIGELSGGQQQRVFLARALAQQANLFLLDEPFVGIDMTSEETILDILKKQTRRGKTVLVVHHDLSKVKHYFHDLIILNKECVASGSVEEVFRTENIAKAYPDLSLLKEMEVNM